VSTRDATMRGGKNEVFLRVCPKNVDGGDIMLISAITILDRKGQLLHESDDYERALHLRLTRYGVKTWNSGACFCEVIPWTAISEVRVRPWSLRDWLSTGRERTV